MKTIRVFGYILAVLVSCNILNSCSNDSSDDLDPVIQDAVAVEDLSGSGDSDVVDDATLKNVISAYLKNERNITSALPYKLSTIKDDAGNVCMYVVNFTGNKGFLIVSATKKYNPILAFADKGCFRTDIMGNMGVELWKQRTISDMKRISRCAPDSLKRFKPMWRAYNDKPVRRLKSRVSMQGLEDDPDYIMMHYVDRWQHEGYNIICLDEPGWTTGDELLDQNIKNTAFSSTYAIYDENWEHYSIVIWKEYSFDDVNIYLNMPIWGQNNGYNEVFPGVGSLSHAYTGCAILAVGQVMRYFEKPVCSASFPYQLNEMPYKMPTLETSQFLYDVFNKFSNKTVTETGTGSNIEESKSVLAKYGYSSKISDGVPGAVDDNLRDSKPVIMRGQINNPSMGHQWIVCGRLGGSYYTKYELYTFTGETAFENVWNYETTVSHVNMYYMNWGWEGYNNGYFNVSAMRLPGYNERISKVRTLYDITYK